MQELDFDKKHIWHPFTQALTASEPLFIKRGNILVRLIYQE
jgi:adenosylmethionine-8-amino-7-oxononanoate aminotransferase